MGNDQDHLSVRRHSRVECDIPAAVVVGGEHAAQIVFSRAVAEGDGSIPARVVDCSEGGVGLRTGVYLPRGAVLEVRVEMPGGAARVLGVRVRRSTLIGREPSYYLGTSLETGEQTARGLAELLAWAREQPREGAA